MCVCVCECVCVCVRARLYFVVCVCPLMLQGGAEENDEILSHTQGPVKMFKNTKYNKDVLPTGTVSPETLQRLERLVPSLPSSTYRTIHLPSWFLRPWIGGARCLYAPHLQMRCRLYAPHLQHAPKDFGRQLAPIEHFKGKNSPAKRRPFHSSLDPSKTTQRRSTPKFPSTTRAWWKGPQRRAARRHLSVMMVEYAPTRSRV